MPIANRPGLPALSYRVGTHATFLETMLARLSNLCLGSEADCRSGKGPYPLQGLKTRDLSDPSIALLDSWATVADVLTFYQERIANEGYLRTATERRSILELARLIGYKLRPGVASTVYLAYTLAEDLSKTPPAPTETTIPAGTRSQSVPGPGELPQSFETSDDLDARSEWNNLHPRLTRPQLITLNTDPGTDASTRDTIYFQGISTNLKPGDAVLIVVGESTSADPKQQVLRIVEAVDAQSDENRTEVTLLSTEEGGSPIGDALHPFLEDASSIFAGSALAGQVKDILQGESEGEVKSFSLSDLSSSVIPQVQELHALAADRKFTRLAPWLEKLLNTLNDLVQAADDEDTSETVSSASTILPSPLGNLVALIEPLSLPPSLQPRNSLALPRSVAQAFSPQSDLAPKLISAFKPAVAEVSYRAWANTEVPGSQVEVDAFRIKAGLFASTFAGAASSTSTPGSGATEGSVSVTTSFAPPDLATAWSGLLDPKGPSPLPTLALDAVYDKILPGSWICIERPVLDSNGKRTADAPIQTYHKVETVLTTAMAADGFSSKVTQLRVNPPWLSDFTAESELQIAQDSTDLLRGAVVYAQAEQLDLSDEPLDIDIEGDTIELDGVYDGLESGRWIIVSGERTDIPKVTGVNASELVMVAGVEQGSRSLNCIPFPNIGVPFSKITYITNANAFGDRLVIGKLAISLEQIQALPKPTVPNQQYCDQVQLAPGFWVNAYVQGGLSGLELDSFSDLLRGSDLEEQLSEELRNKKGSLWAWRVSSAKAHTILSLFNKLAYTYDLDTVTIYGNVVKATNGETRNEVLGSGDGSQTLQEFTLKQSPLTFVAASNPTGVDSTLEVYVNNVEWHETDTLAGLGPKDRSFITTTDDNDNTTVVFGNGAKGARLPTGTGNVKAVYRNGIGKPGNVDANQISLLQSKPLNVKAVINPLRASGGADRDGLDQARGNAPLAVMALDRLVAVRDYADFSRTFAGIGKASAARLSDGSRQLVHVTIAGANDIPIDLNSDLYGNLVRSLHVNGDPYEPIQVAVRKLKLLVIAANASILPDYLWESVAVDLRSALLDAFAFDRRDLGQPVFQSEVISALQAVTGVAYADLQIFDAVAEDVTAAQLAGLAGSLVLETYIEVDLARLNPNPTDDPSSRILPAELAYLTPDIPDTLILNEVKS
jgi:hypothetical protein